MYGQQGFQFFAALLELQQSVSEFVPATVITPKIVPALLAFKYGNGRNHGFAPNTNSGDIDPKRGTRSPYFRGTTSVAAAVGPEKSDFLEASVRRRLARRQGQSVLSSLSFPRFTSSIVLWNSRRFPRNRSRCNRRSGHSNRDWAIRLPYKVCRG